MVGESGESVTEPWKWILAVIVLGIGVVLGWQSRFKPLVDFFCFKIGNCWCLGWLENVILEQGSHFLVFMSKDCPYCKQWVPLMNIMNMQSDFPNVLGVMSLQEEELVEFKGEHLVRFPLKSMSKLLWGYMAKAYPTAVLVENGVIAKQWQEFLRRIQQFYQAVSLGETTKKARFSG
ncbi:MAG: hypothetical protein GDA44_15210 [Prochloron sp. SP5CPC1]|nr:hypothetical protein [Candidatus Paraprochloron terpiosi SP5CPC1]